MLHILSCRPGESIVLGNGVRLTIRWMKGDHVTLELTGTTDTALNELEPWLADLLAGNTVLKDAAPDHYGE